MGFWVKDISISPDFVSFSPALDFSMSHFSSCTVRSFWNFTKREFVAPW